MRNQRPVTYLSRRRVNDEETRGKLVRILRCESSEDGDGAAVRCISKLEQGRMPDPSQFERLVLAAQSAFLYMEVFSGEQV